MSSPRSLLIRFAFQWSLLFTGLILSLWAATQSRQAPQFILLIVLQVISQNFSVPAGQLRANLLPLVGITGVLVLGWPGFFIMTLIGWLVAELTLPLWKPLWQRANYAGAPFSTRFIQGLVHLVALSAAAMLYQRTPGPLPLSPDTFTIAAAALGWLVLSYSLLVLILTFLWHTLRFRSLSNFWRGGEITILIYLVLSQPFALIGGLIFADLGLLAFTVFCVGIAILAQMNWLSWQQRTILQQQVNQFALMNQVGDSLRETLDPQTVLERTSQQIQQLLTVDVFTIALVDDSGQWYEPLRHAPYSLDGFTQWVATRGRILDLDQETMPYAHQHALTTPTPLPAYWLGFPLKTAERIIGVMSLQRFAGDQPFSRWNREVLLALAAQVSTAIENARRHSETLRLYTLTDEALARRLEQLQALLDSTHEGVLMLDTRGRVVLINPLAAQLMEQTPDVLRDEPLFLDQDAAALGFTPLQLRQLLQELLTGAAHSARRTRFTRLLQGRTTHLERSEGPVLTTNGQVMGWLMVFRDVTEEQERLEWRTELTRMIVHDLRNPVTTLLSTMHLLGEQLFPGSTSLEAGELVETARLSCVNLLDMVDSLMDINRMEAGQLIVDADAVSLSALVERVLIHLRPLALRRQIELHFTASPDIPLVWVDEDLLRRVWLNLLDNALKFTPAHGTITIHLQPEPPLSERDEPGVRGIVQDTGPGIPPEYQERVFDRFVQINRGGAQIRGTGLGLTFCKLAVEAHRGRIWVENAAAGGSCFVFTLPGIPRLP